MKKLDVPQSGSQASTTASRNRFGQYNRTRATPIQPRTSFQMAVRSAFSTASALWQSLTADSRAAWNAYAAASPKLDSLGQTVFQTGHQAFVGRAVLYSAWGLDLATDVPAVPAPPSPIVSVFTVKATGDFVISGTSDESTSAVGIYLSPPVSPGVSFIGDYRLIGVAVPVAGVWSLTTGGNWVSRFGTPVTGRKIGLRAQGVDEADYTLASAPSQSSAIVTVS